VPHDTSLLGWNGELIASEIIQKNLEDERNGSNADHLGLHYSTVCRIIQAGETVQDRAGEGKA
jgi:hypothetical protein